MTPADEDVELLRKQNAMLMRALMRAKAERDALLKQIAVLTSEPASEKQAAAR